MEHTVTADDATEGQGAGGGRDATRTRKGDCARAKVQRRSIGTRVGKVSGKTDRVVRRERQVCTRRVIKAEARAFQEVQDTRAEGVGVVQTEATLANDETSGDRIRAPQGRRIGAQLDEGVAAGEQRFHRLTVSRWVEVNRTVTRQVQRARAADIARNRVGITRAVRGQGGSRVHAIEGKEGHVEVRTRHRTEASIVDAQRAAIEDEVSRGVGRTNAPPCLHVQRPTVQVIGAVSGLAVQRTRSRGAVIDGDKVGINRASVLVEPADAINADVDTAVGFARLRADRRIRGHVRGVGVHVERPAIHRVVKGAAPVTDTDLPRVDRGARFLDHGAVIISQVITQAQVGQVQGRTIADDEARISDPSTHFQTTARPARDGDEVILIRARPVR